MNRNIFIFLMTAALLLFSAQQSIGESEPENTQETMKEQIFRDFQIRIYSDDETGQSRLEILKKGKRIYEQQADGKFSLYQADREDIEYGKSFVKDHKIHPKDTYESVPIGRDIYYRKRNFQSCHFRMDRRSALQTSPSTSAMGNNARSDLYRKYG